MLHLLAAIEAAMFRIAYTLALFGLAALGWLALGHTQLAWVVDASIQSSPSLC